MKQVEEATTYSAIGRLYPNRILQSVRHQLARQRWEKSARRHMAQSRTQTDGLLWMRGDEGGIDVVARQDKDWF